MNLKKTAITVIILFFISMVSLNAQTSDTATLIKTDYLDLAHEPKLNYFKVNLTSLLLKTYSFQYERVLSKRISIAASYRTMPATQIPFKNIILKQIDVTDQETKDAIEKLRLSNIGFTPEIRFYLGKKGYGRGFYLAPFYRYAKFKIQNLQLDYQNNAGQDGIIDLSGNFTSNTGGLLMGAQWALGKSICLDWWILGPHYGQGTGILAGVSSKQLSQSEQDDIRQQLEDIDIPLTEKTINVNANGASLKLDGPWGGIRAGLSLGIRF